MSAQGWRSGAAEALARLLLPVIDLFSEPFLVSLRSHGCRYLLAPLSICSSPLPDRLTTRFFAPIGLLLALQVQRSGSGSPLSCSLHWVVVHQSGLIKDKGQLQCASSQAHLLCPLLRSPAFVGVRFCKVARSLLLRCYRRKPRLPAEARPEGWVPRTKASKSAWDSSKGWRAAYSSSSAFLASDSIQALCRCSNSARRCSSARSRFSFRSLARLCSSIRAECSAARRAE